MRVITGLAKGKRLEPLPGLAVRPTTDRVKEAVFSALQFDIPGKRFLDLFSGSGQMGIEALSRGAREAVFVDKSAKAIETIKKNLAHTNLAANAKIFAMDAASFLAQEKNKFDFVYLDPPYETGQLEEVLLPVSMLTNPGGVIICEHPVTQQLERTIGEFSIYKEFKYGKIKITLYKNLAKGG